MRISILGLLPVSHGGQRNSFASTVCRLSALMPAGEQRNREAFTTATNQQRIPHGKIGWPEIVAGNLFYIDKTKAIEDLESNCFACKLWRPARSGKSLLCQQLASYYDVAVPKSQFDELFGHTYIGKNPTAERGKYHILSFNFNEVEHSYGVDMKQSFNDYINIKVREFVDKYPAIGEKVVVDPNNHLCTLDNLLFEVERAKQKLYIIIDDYDAIAKKRMLQIDTTTSKRNAALGAGKQQYKSLFSVMDSFLRVFGAVLKSSSAVERIFVTGIVPVALPEDLTAWDISDDPCFETTFGFTSDEVKDALALIYPRDSAEFNRCFTEMQENFSGYRFNEDQQVAVSNPQLCLYYLDELRVLRCGSLAALAEANQPLSDHGSDGNDRDLVGQTVTRFLKEQEDKYKSNNYYYKSESNKEEEEEGEEEGEAETRKKGMTNYPQEQFEELLLPSFLRNAAATTGAGTTESSSLSSFPESTIGLSSSPSSFPESTIGLSSSPSSYPENPMDFLIDCFDYEVYGTLHVNRLFDAHTVNNAMCSLAFYNGYLTYANSAVMSEKRGLLVPPNMATKKLFENSMVAKLLPIVNSPEELARLQAAAIKEFSKHLKVFLETRESDDFK